eukprot:gene4889-6847_t
MDSRNILERLDTAFDWFLDHITGTSFRIVNILIFSLKAGVLFLLLVFNSVVLCIILRNYTVPRALVHRELYFDYSNRPVQAKINLSLNEDQWYYLKNHQSQVSLKSRALLSGSFYTLGLKFALAKSHRNYDIGKFSVNMTLMNSQNEGVAESIRPVSIPYQSTVSRVLETLAYFPLKFIGMAGVDEMVEINLEMINNFQEPVNPFTSSICITVSNDAADISSTKLYIYPKVYGLTYVLYYYPVSSFIYLMLMLTGVQSVGCIFVGMIWYLCQKSSNIEDTPVRRRIRYPFFSTLINRRNNTNDLSYPLGYEPSNINGNNNNDNINNKSYRNEYFSTSNRLLNQNRQEEFNNVLQIRKKKKRE